MMLDLTMPIIPREIFSTPDMEYCKDLWESVCNEFLDETYASRAHHNAGTYDKGCHGPLCRKANREHARRRKANRTAILLREEQLYDPVMEYFHTIIKLRVRTVQLSILKDIKEHTG